MAEKSDTIKSSDLATIANMLHQQSLSMLDVEVRVRTDPDNVDYDKLASDMQVQIGKLVFFCGRVSAIMQSRSEAGAPRGRLSSLPPRTVEPQTMWPPLERPLPGYIEPMEADPSTIEHR